MTLCQREYACAPSPLEFGRYDFAIYQGSQIRHVYQRFFFVSRWLKALEMSPTEYHIIQSGIHTQSVLKKTKYTHKYMKLLVSKLGLPINHSGQKVMKPSKVSNVALVFDMNMFTDLRRARR